MKILVVDDEPAVRESLRRALQLEGYEVALARDGLEALESVHADGVDAIVLDVSIRAGASAAREAPCPC
jgi:two-component system response regulator MprA